MIPQEFQYLIGKLQELLAVEQLEYHNKNWLNGSESWRSEQKQAELKYLISRFNTLALDIAGKRPKDNLCETQSIDTQLSGKVRQG